MRKFDGNWIIAGHSHIVAMGVPLRSEDGRPCFRDIPADSERFVGFTGHWSRDQSYYDELIRVAPGRIIALVWMGNQYDAAFRIARTPPIDFVLSSNRDLILADTALLVPEEAIDERLNEGFSGLTYLVDQLRKQPDCHVILCGSPPPKKGYNKIREEMLNFPEYWSKISEQAGVEFAQFRVASPYFLLKTWCVLQNKYFKFAKDHGIQFLAAPSETLTHEGFLAEEYWGSDYSHANDRYGDLVRDTIWNTFVELRNT